MGWLAFWRSDGFWPLIITKSMDAALGWTCLILRVCMIVRPRDTLAYNEVTYENMMLPVPARPRPMVPEAIGKRLNSHCPHTSLLYVILPLQNTHHEGLMLGGQLSSLIGNAGCFFL
jgi:hypothetical protein